jgi:hypothetical protein
VSLRSALELTLSSSLTFSLSSRSLLSKAFLLAKILLSLSSSSVFSLSISSIKSAFAVSFASL